MVQIKIPFRSNSNMNQRIILCMFVFICELSYSENYSTRKISHIIPGTRQIKGDENFTVAKKFNRKDNYSETFSMQNETVPTSCIRTKGYENYKLLSVKISCHRDKNSIDRSERMLSGGQKNNKNKVIHAKYKFEKVLRVLEQGKLTNNN